MKKIIFVLALFLIINVSAATAEINIVGKEDSGTNNLINLVTPTPPAITSNTTVMNSSTYANCWSTAEGIKCDVADITYDEISGGDVDASGYTGTFSFLNGVVGGIDMRGDPWYLSGTDLEIAENLDVAGNGSFDWINAKYLSGQPTDGSIGSGIQNASSIKIHCGCVNASDAGGLNVWYPNSTVKLWNYGTNTYCDIAEDTYTVPDNAHTVYYVDSSCSIQTTTFANYKLFNLNPASWVRLFDVYTHNGDIELVKGASVIGIEQIKSEFNNLNCPGGGHLSVCDGMMITKGNFPEINMSSGHFKYANTVTTSQHRDSNPDGLHVTCNSDGSHTVETEMDIDKCDNGVTCDTCPDNKYRRYIIYNIGWGSHTKIHQLAPLDGETYTTLANCINIVKNPLSYTIPSSEKGVAVPLAFYCGRRDDTSWTNGIVDLRLSGGGFGASPDLSGFITYTEWNSNANANDFNLTSLNYLQATTLNITGNITLFDRITFKLGSYLEELGGWLKSSTGITSPQINATNITTTQIAVENNLTIGSRDPFESLPNWTIGVNSDEEYVWLNSTGDVSMKLQQNGTLYTTGRVYQNAVLN